MSDQDVRPLRLNIWGRPGVTGPGGHELRFTNRKDLILLAILANEGGKRWDRAELAAIIWPESDDPAARASLRSSLKSLRKVLPPEAIEAVSATVSLRPGFVETEPLPNGAAIESVGLFSGWSHPWVLELRRSLVARAVDEHLERALRFIEIGEDSEAKAELDRAGGLDPDNDRLARLRLRLSGAGRSIVVSSPFDEDAEPVVSVGPLRFSTHPLTAAGSYLLASGPAQAVDFLASTNRHWGAVPLAEAIDLHTRALANCSTDSAARRKVEAMAVFLNATNGAQWTTEDNLLILLQREIKNNDTANAALICSALSILAQQSGRLFRAMDFAATRARLLSQGHLPEAKARGEFYLANIERHGGRYEAASVRNLGALRVLEELGSSEDIAFCNLTAATDAVWAGALDQAEAHVRRAKSLFAQSQNLRLKPWAEMARGFLLESAGQLEEARGIFVALRDQGLERSGQVFRAGIEDHLLRIDIKMGEWDESLLEWATAKRIRRRFGLITSPFERAMTRPSKHVLRDRVGMDSMRAFLERLPMLQERTRQERLPQERA